MSDTAAQEHGYSVEPNPRVTLRLVHEDDAVLVVSKPAGVVSTPGKGHQRDSMLNGLFATHGNVLQNLGQGREFGLLHRLDRDTSGLLIVAKTIQAYESLRAQLEARTIKKFYYALCAKEPREPKGVIKLPIAQRPDHMLHRDGKKLAQAARRGAAGKAAVTAYRVTVQCPQESTTVHEEGPVIRPCVVEARAVTGRLHQVRIHLDAVGSPILGDALYGPRYVHQLAPRLMLHAHRVSFTHPTSGQEVDVRVGLARDMRGVMNRFGLQLDDAASEE